MSTLSPNHSYSGSLPYKQVINAHQQALAYARQRLQPQFPNITDEQWESLFVQYQPTLWVESDTPGAMVEEQALERFANWIHLSLDTDLGEDAVPLYSHDAYYLARNDVWYTQQAKRLLASDPKLTRPESVEGMRALIYRLAAGNSIAERIYSTYENLVAKK
ncbi:hypothetical protein KLP40_01320 [Hymenobacter sp. NST-14]|uniref:hypothetical protein n=1 Tax=Hymenobacter piscis TaxID=2839984 RepID=UPI001C018110|nr:hypothetical protein [Hymenobacter piscis]MBT9391787.1 hypothetical protein [Hymenobacter piscis]